jgi:hypothetical protein
MAGSDSLTQALFQIYSDAGTQVTYVTEKGETRPYWANRFRQAVQRAVEEDDVEGLVERMVTGQVSRGFGYLEAAERLDLTVEALVAERFRDRFSDEIVAAAEERLREHGYEPQAVEAPGGGEARPRGAPVGEFNLRVSVAADGTVSARLI